jgi:hypothetical protein
MTVIPGRRGRSMAAAKTQVLRGQRSVDRFGSSRIFCRPSSPFAAGAVAGLTENRSIDRWQVDSWLNGGALGTERESDVEFAVSLFDLAQQADAWCKTETRLRLARSASARMVS